MHHDLLQFPPAFIALLKKTIPPGRMKEGGEFFLKASPTTWRINRLAGSSSEIIQSLKRDGILAKPYEAIPDSFILTEGSFQKLERSEAYQNGAIYCQSLSSQVPVHFLELKPGMKVLDCCAAPGGKTTQIASLMNNEGEVFAYEPDSRRYQTLEANVKKQKASSVLTFNKSILELPKEHQGTFERVLCDVPCSSSGTFKLKERGPWRGWSPEIVLKMAELQKKIILTAFDALKSKGILVYSTCSLSVDENENVFDFLLSERKNLEICKINLPRYASPVLSPNKIGFRILPQNLFEGFFVGVIQKK